MNHILSIIAFVVALGIFFGYVHPTWTGSVAATKVSIKASEEALDAAQRFAAQQNELASARNAMDPQMLARLEKLLPDSVDNVGIILDLNALATRSGVLLSNVDVAAAGAQNGEAASDPSASPVGSLELSLSAVGTYNAFQEFLAGIEKSARLLDVYNIDVTASDTGTYDYRMTIRLYWLP
jgi:Tfp pilus assembly protein PilO